MNIPTPREREIRKKQRETLIRLMYFVSGALFAFPIALYIASGVVL